MCRLSKLSGPWARWPNLSAVALAAVPFLSSACSDTSGPDAVPASMEILAGDGQQLYARPIGSSEPNTLPEPLVVRVLNGRGRPVPDVTVRFRMFCDPRWNPEEAGTTDSDGSVSARVVLWPGCVGPFEVHAEVPPLEPVVFRGRAWLLGDQSTLGIPAHLYLEPGDTFGILSPQAGLDTSFPWALSSTDGSVAAVDSNGLVRAVGPGRTVIRGTPAIPVTPPLPPLEMNVAVDVVPTGGLLTLSCLDPGGTQHTGSRPKAELWRRATSPHHVSGSVVFMWEGGLDVEAGSLVCLDAGSNLVSNHALSARGSPARPIRFEKLHPDSPDWGIIVGMGGPQARLVLEHVQLGGAVIRAVRGTAVLSNSVMQGSLILSEASAELDHVLLRGAPRNGIEAHWGSLSLSDTRVEGAGEVGLLMFEGATLARAENVTITGSGTYPAVLMESGPSGLKTRRLIEGPQAAARLTGNGRDTVIAMGAAGGSVYPGLALRLQPRNGWSAAVAGWERIALQAGATLTLAARSVLGFVEATGDHSRPATLRSGGDGQVVRLTVADPPSEEVRLFGVQIHGVEVEGVGGPLAVFGARLDMGSALILGGLNSRVLATTVDDAGLGAEPGPSGARAAISLLAPLGRVWGVRIRKGTGDGILVAGRLADIRDCLIEGVPGDAVRVSQGFGTVVRGCSFQGIGGVGVNNLSADTVDARGNWWGSPDGPLGAGGVGVSGPVLYEPWLTNPPPGPFSSPSSAAYPWER